MNTLSGVSWPVFLGLTVMVFGGCALLAGQAAADAWRSVWVVVGQAALLGVADRFLVYALFQGPLGSLGGFFGDTAVLQVIALAAYRATLARRLCAQYPWLYQRTGPFTWRERLEPDR